MDFTDVFQLVPEVLTELNEFRCLDFKTVEGMQGAKWGLVQKYWQDADLNDRNGADSDSFQDSIDRENALLECIPFY